MDVKIEVESTAVPRVSDTFLEDVTVPTLTSETTKRLMRHIDNLEEVQDTGLFSFNDVETLLEVQGAYIKLMDELTKPEPYSNLVAHAERELEELNRRQPPVGNDMDPEWSNMIDEAVVGLVKTFAHQRHSGGSAMTTLALFDELVRFNALSPLTTDPKDWVEVGEDLHQNRRQSSCFSNNGGKTYWNIEEKSWLSKLSEPFANFLFQKTGRKFKRLIHPIRKSEATTIRRSPYKA